MLQSIVDNPFRILGVYANASDSEIEEATKKLLNSPESKSETDFLIDGLPAPQRDAESIINARATIIDGSKSFGYKLFWFMKTPDGDDELALQEGDLGSITDYFSLSSSMEHNHNVVVAYLILSNYSDAVERAYVNFMTGFYRRDYLQTESTYYQLLDVFKSLMYVDHKDLSPTVDIANNDSAQRVENALIQRFKEKTLEAMQRARSVILTNSPISYLNALSTIWNQRLTFIATKDFLNQVSDEYAKPVQTISNHMLSWIEDYLSISKDIFKYKNVQQYANGISNLTLNNVQASYSSLIGWNCQQATQLSITSQICDLYCITAQKIYAFYKKENKSSNLYRDIIENTAPAFVRLKEAMGEDSRSYKLLANFMAQVGLSIIRSEISKSPSDQVIADGGSVICYIDRVISDKYLFTDIKNERNICMNKLWDLGLAPKDYNHFSNAGNLMRWDSCLYLNEDETFKSCYLSLKYCQNYLKRFPEGKYVNEVKELITNNVFKYPSVHSNSSQQQAKVKPNSSSTTPFINKANQGKVSMSNSSGKVSSQKRNVSGSNVRANNISRTTSRDGVYKFILIALLIELLLGVLVGAKTMLIVGIIMSVGYWIYIPSFKYGFDKDSRIVLYIYLLGQLALSIIGLNLIK